MIPNEYAKYYGSVICHLRLTEVPDPSHTLQPFLLGHAQCNLKLLPLCQQHWATDLLALLLHMHDPLEQSFLDIRMSNCPDPF